MQARCKRKSLSPTVVGGVGMAVAIAVGLSAAPVQARSAHRHVVHHHRAHLAVASHPRSLGAAPAASSIG